MKEYGLTALIAATVTYLLVPLVRRFAIAIGAMKQPRERDVHTEPVPTLGGLALYGGMAAGLLVASRMFPLSTVFQGTRVGTGLLLAGAVVVLVGFVDDRWGLGVITKLAGQVVAAVVLVWSGALVSWLPWPGGGTLAITSDETTALTILVVVVTINAVNFIDGLDGLAAGIVAIGAAAFYLYYYTLAKRVGLSEQDDPALAAAVLLGVCVGFLPHNFHPARIFMGDTGSMLLGLLLAYAPISSLATLDPLTLAGPAAYRGGTVNRFPEVLPLLVPAIIMLIPYADLLLAVVRRTRAGMSPFAADKKHLQHRLLDIGHSHRASVLIMYMWAALFAGTVVLLSIMRTKVYVLGIVTVGGILVLLLLSMPRLRWWAKPEAGRRPAAPGATPPAAPRSAASPALAGAVAGAGRPAAGVPVPPDHVGYLSSPTRPSPVPADEAPWPAPGPLESGRPLRTPPTPERPAPAGPAARSQRPAAGHAGNGSVPGSAGTGYPAGSRAGGEGRPAGNGYLPGEHAGNGYLPGNGYPAGRDEDATGGTPGGYPRAGQADSPAGYDLAGQAGEPAGYDLAGQAGEPAGYDLSGWRGEPGGHDRAARAAQQRGGHGPEDGADGGPGREEPGDDAPPWFIGRPGAG